MRTSTNWPGLSVGAVTNVHDAIDFRRVGAGAADGAVRIGMVDDRLERGADLARQFPRADLGLLLHETREAVLLFVFVDRIGQFIRLRALHRRIGESADAIELRFVEEREQFLELLLRSRRGIRR